MIKKFFTRLGFLYFLIKCSLLLGQSRMADDHLKICSVLDQKTLQTQCRSFSLGSNFRQQQKIFYTEEMTFDVFLNEKKFSLLAEGEPQSINLNKKYLDQSMQIKWSTIFKTLEKEINSSMIIAQSRWAKEEMKNYHYQPMVQPPTFKIVGQEKNLILLKADGVKLPSHHHLVHRSLKFYLLTDEKSFLQSFIAWVTIEGERWE